jgi:hypothetical protein
MKRFLTPLLGIFMTLPLTTFANQSQADTIGMKITHTHKIIETTIHVEERMDSIVSLDLPKLTTVTRDTLKAADTTFIIDTSYFVTMPLKLWRIESVFDASATQIARWNWTRGGGNMLSFLLANNTVAAYARGSSTWKNELDWRYGMQKQDKDPLFKTQDRINIMSQYGFRASPTWYYSGLFQFNTQLTKSWSSIAEKQADTNNPKSRYISRFLSPARFTFSLGMEYVNTPKTVTLFLSPTAYRATYVGDTLLSTRFGIEPGKHWLATFGPMAMLTNKHRLTQNSTLSSRLELFADILKMGDPFVTVDWKLNLDFRLSRYFTLGFETWLIFNPNERFGENKDQYRAQFQQSMMLRFVYRITN